MKNLILTFSILSLGFNSISAQDIHQNKVPSIILNSFQKSFPKKARDTDWEIKGTLYKVEFETGLLGDDHSAYYSHNGKLVRHEEEISKNDLPKPVLASLKKQYSSYKVDDAKRISDHGKILYKIEIKNYLHEWKLAIDAYGRILDKKED